MTKFKKSSELLWALGIIFIALGVSICNKADLGVSMIAAPAFVVSDAIAKVFSGFTVGVAEYSIQGIALIILCLVIKKFNWRYLLSFVVAVIYGYTLNFFIWCLSSITVDTVYMRWVMLLVGDCFTAFGVACFFKTYLPIQIHELFVTELSRTFKFDINKTKWIFDISSLLISILLAVLLFDDIKTFDWSTITHSSFHNLGLGTLVTTIINSPIIKLMSKLIDKLFVNSPLLPKVENLLKRT